MQKWEYLTMIAKDENVIEIDGQLVQAHSLQNALEKAGDEGWELVGITAISEAQQRWRMVLKRPKNVASRS
jgi:hypothetical protein